MSQSLLILTLLLSIFSFQSFAAVDEQQAIAAAAQKLHSLNVCDLGSVDVTEIQSEMEALDQESYNTLKEMAAELDNKALKKHLDKYTYSKFYYLNYEPEDCDAENLIIQVNRDQGQAKGLIMFEEEKIKTRDL